MRWIKNKILIIIIVFINLLFALNLMKKVLLIEKFNNFFICMLFLISIFVYWLFSFVLNTKKRKVVFFIVFLSVTAIFMLKKYDFIINFININYINKFTTLYDLTLNNKSTYFFQYKYILSLVFIVLVPILTALTYKFNKLILILNFAYVISMWYLGYSDEIINYLWSYLFISSLSYVAIIYNKKIDKYKKQNFDIVIEKIKIIVYVIIFCLLVTSCTVILPQNIKGTDSSEFGLKLINKFTNRSTSNLKNKSYTLKDSGYINNDKKLGGPVSLNDNTAFKIKGSNVKHLRGVVKNYYNGHMWTNNRYVKLWKKDSENDIVNTNRLEVTMKKKGTASISIKPKGLKSVTFLSPFHSYNIKNSDGSVFYNDIPIFSTDTLQKSEYTIYYDQLLFEEYKEFRKGVLDSNKYNDNVLSISIDGRSDILTDYCIGNLQYSKESDNKNIFKRNNFEEQYVNNNYYIMEKDKLILKYGDYLQVPAQVPYRIYKLVYDITKNCKNNFEKEENIINYLQKNFPYTTNVSEVPDDREFVDYFIFNEKKGYCTYFATAAAVMFRIAGIPSRYVEGFALKDSIDNIKYTAVTNEQAHAWCEILIDPSKEIWCAAEIYAEPFENKLNAQQNTESNDDSQNINNTQVVKKNSLKRDVDGSDYNKNQNIAAKIIMIIILLAVLIIIIKCIVYNNKKKKILQYDSIIPLYKNTLKRLRTINIIKQESLGDMEFASQIEDKILKNKLLNIVEVYYNEYYGNKSIKKFDKIEFYNFIEKYIKDRKNRLRYYYELTKKDV